MTFGDLVRLWPSFRVLWSVVHFGNYAFSSFDRLIAIASRRFQFPAPVLGFDLTSEVTG